MSKSAATEHTFEELMGKIEALTAKLDDPETGIERSLGLYEEAMKLVAEAKERLSTIEHKFEEIQKQTQLPSKERGTSGDRENAQETLL